MGRPLRQAKGNIIYHVINRANGRMTLFRKDKDFEAFENEEKVKKKGSGAIYIVFLVCYF